MKSIKFSNFSASVIGIALIFAGTANASEWERIDLAGPYTVEISDGDGGTVSRTVEPSCSGGPVLDDNSPAGFRTGKSDYYFFVRAGNPNRILIALDGGGACWDAATCIGSPLTGSSTYTVELDETAEGLGAGQGLLDITNEDNPYKNYTQVFVPYCSADIHWGSKDTTYELPGLPPFEIKHRGSDNVLSVLNWLKTNGRKKYRLDFGRARDITVTGLSAGGYGATLAYPYVAEMAPRARLNLISDAAIGVQTQEFYNQTVYNAAAPESASWGVKDSLPLFVPGLNETFLATTPASFFTPALFGLLSNYTPDAKLSALTHDFDGVQVFFYALQTGQLQVLPNGDVQPTAAAFGAWNFQMKAITAATASNPNYRFFIRQGFQHTFLANDEQTYDIMGNGISVADWITNQIKPGNRVWDNLGGM
jgi:hypothetical protein